METDTPTTTTATTSACTTPEPWGRYSASGGIYPVKGVNYLYSFGGDTQSDADGRGGVVRTNFRFNLVTKCWERLGDGPVNSAVGYRATATWLKNGNGDTSNVVYVLFGADGTRAAVNQSYQYSLSDDTWTRLVTDPRAISVAMPPARWKHAAVQIGITKILIVGGRNGNTVHNDAWVLDTQDLSWSLLSTTGLPAMYRHGLAFDARRNVTWIYGGLDGTFSRYQSQLWQLNMTSMVVTQVGGVPSATDSSLPPRLASHAMEYVAELDVLLLWGGTCSDESELHIYHPSSNSWCHISPNQRPDRRDAMLWSLQYPYFYVAQGDSICYNRQVLTLADVHVLDLRSTVLSILSDNATGTDTSTLAHSWEMIYEPTNVPRGTGMEPYCDGSNAGFCQPRPVLLLDESKDNSAINTCASLWNVATDKDDEVGTSTVYPSAPTTFVPSPARPGNLDVKVPQPSASDIDSSHAFYCSQEVLTLMTLIFTMKIMLWY